MNKFARILRSNKAAVAGALATVAASSQAAPVDVTGVVTDIAGQAAPVAAIGGAVLLIVVAVKAFKWVRSAIS